MREEGIDMENSTGAAPVFCTLCANNCSVSSLECGRGYKFFAEMASGAPTDESKGVEMNRENRSFTEHEGRGFRRGRAGCKGHEGRDAFEIHDSHEGHEGHGGHEGRRGRVGRRECEGRERSHDHDCGHDHDHSRNHDCGHRRGRGRGFGRGRTHRSGRVGDPARFCGSTQDEKLVFLVAECAHAFRHGGAALRGRDLVLEALGSHGGTMSQRNLLDLAGTRPASLSELLSRMETEGLISRMPDEQDRRGMVVELTESGTEAARAAGNPHRSSAADAFSALSDEEKSQLEQLLARVAASIGR